MNNNEFVKFCLEKKCAYVDFSFGEGVCVVKLKGKVFAQAFILKGVETITLNCSADGGMYYRNMYPDIVTRGYHCPPVQQPYFNSMTVNALSNNIILEMIEHSYLTVISKLPKYVQAEIKNL